MPNQGDINDYGSAGAGSKSTPRGLDRPSELRWRSTGRSGEGSEKRWMLVAKAERKSTDVVMFVEHDEHVVEQNHTYMGTDHDFACRHYYNIRMENCG